MSYVSETMRIKEDEFLRRVAKGEEKTVKEWALELFADEIDVSNVGDVMRRRNTVLSWMRKARLSGEMLFSMQVGGKHLVFRVNNDKERYYAVWTTLVAKAEGAISRAATVGELMVRHHPSLAKVALDSSKTLGSSARQLSSFINIKI